MHETEHPFIVGLDYLFQNDKRLYFVMPFVKGGELYQIKQNYKKLHESWIKFIAA